MSKLSQKVMPLAVAALILPLAACSTPTPELTKAGALEAFKPLHASPQDTCSTQREIAQHNSAYDSLKTGKDVTYKASCDADKKRIASSQ